MTSPTRIIPGVFVGDQFTAKNFEFFVENNIQRVVNCTPDVPFYFPWVTYMRINLNDSVDENAKMASSLIPAVKFILDGKPSNESGILIHCHAGISRSCTVAVALLRICCAESLEMATAMLLHKRPIAFFNGTAMNFKPALVKVFKS